MKSRIVVLIVALPVLMVGLSCSNADEKGMSSRQRELDTRVRNTIADLDHAIARSERSIEAAGDSTTADLQNELEGLRKTRDELQKSIDEIGNTADDRWDAFRRNVDSLLAEANRVLRKNNYDTLQVEMRPQ